MTFHKDEKTFRNYNIKYKTLGFTKSIVEEYTVFSVGNITVYTIDNINFLFNTDSPQEIFNVQLYLHQQYGL